MTAKLTLMIDKCVVARAKVYAVNSGCSLSELIENYLISITEESNHIKLSPKLSKLVGAVKLPMNFNEEDELQNYLNHKYQ